MMVDKITEVLIYESPDGGKTVYSRRMGERDRQLHSQCPEHKKELDRAARLGKWTDILKATETNPELQSLCEQVEILYELSRR